MSKETQDFLLKSPIARKITIPTQVILHRTKLNLNDISKIKKSGRWISPAINYKKCELEAGGVVIARGEIVESEGKAYFKIYETRSEADE